MSQAPSSERRYPAPEVSPETAAFWQAANEGRLLLKACRACGRIHWYPRAVCPLCGSDDTHWQSASGRGTVYAVTVTYKAGPSPYALAYVRLEEGVTLMSNIVDCDPESVRIGDPVVLTFQASEDGQALPLFKPA
jgi:uncharacterized OB-fold protein